MMFNRIYVLAVLASSWCWGAAAVSGGGEKPRRRGLMYRRRVAEHTEIIMDIKTVAANEVSLV